MCSTKSKGVGQRAGSVSLPCTSRLIAASLAATRRSALIAAGERPTERHSEVSWLMGAMAWRDFVGEGMADTVAVLPPPIPPTTARLARQSRMPWGPVVWAPDDIEEFYDADPRRRPSAEIELGTEWQDAHGVRYELNYVEE